jgi:large subunit ribosomal protein L5
MARLKEFYQQNVVPQLKKEMGYKNIMQVPKLTKVVVNMGLGDAVQNPKLLESGVGELTQITGQKPVVTRAHKSIANFKLR